MSTTVLLGNINPLQPEVDGPSITTFVLPNGVQLVEALRTVTFVYQGPPGATVDDGHHSLDPPEWVESTDPVLAAALAQFWTWADGERLAPDSEQPEPVDPDDPDAEPVEPVYLEAHTCTVGRPTEWTSHGDDATVETEAPA